MQGTVADKLEVCAGSVKVGIRITIGAAKQLAAVAQRYVVVA